MCRLRSVFKTLCPSFTSKQITQYVHELDRGFRSCMKHSETIDFARSKPAGGDGSVSHSEFIHWIKNGSQDPRFTATQLKPSCFAQVFFLCFPLGGVATEVYKMILKETGDAMSARVREVFQRRSLRQSTHFGHSMAFSYVDGWR